MDIGSHSETLTFDVAPLGKHNIVLGLPWLQWHNLTIHWKSRKVTFISDYCEEHCLAQPTGTFLNQWPIVLMVVVENEVSEIVVEPLSEECNDIAFFPLFLFLLFLFHSVPLHSTPFRSTLLHSRFPTPLFPQSPSRITLFGSAVLRDMTAFHTQNVTDI